MIGGSVSVVFNQRGVDTPADRIELSPHINGQAVRLARERLGLSPLEVVGRAEGAFDAKWLAAAEDGARVDRRQLTRLAALLEVEPLDITLSEDSRSPYRGLLAFEPDDAELFGGREAATAKILDLLNRQPIVAVVGASGSGKSSVVKAGVIAHLRELHDPDWRVLMLRPGSDPLLAFARALGSELDRDADEDSRILKARERAGTLFKGGAKLDDYLASIVALRTERGSRPPRLLVFVDQWEELYTQVEDTKFRSVFLEYLSNAFAKGPHRLIFTLRADFTGHLSDDQRAFFDAVEPGMTLLPRMTREEMARSIRKPTEVVGLSFDEGLVEAILDDAGEEPGVLALVEFTLTQLWERRDKEHNQMTLAAYHAMGGLDGAIDRHAEAVYAKLSPEQQSAARSALTRLVHVSTLDSYTRARRLLSEFSKEGQAVIRALAEEDNRLVVVSYDEEAQEDVAEVSHEALVREWKKLHDWVAADPQFLQWNDAVERRRRRFDKNGRRDDDLLMGSDLDEALAWLRTRGASVAAIALSGGSQSSDSQASVDDISLEVREFIVASQVRRDKLDAERKDTEARLQKSELEQKTLALENARAIADANRRTAQRTSIGLVVALVFAIIGGVFGYYALNEKADALNQKKLTELLLTLPKVYFTLEDAPLDALRSATTAVKELQALGDKNFPFTYYYYAQIANRARELPPIAPYPEYAISKSKILVSQATPNSSSADSASSEAPRLTLIGSSSIVGVIDQNGHAVATPVSALDQRLFANSASWVTKESYALATGQWSGDNDNGDRKATHASLRIYDFSGAIKSTLLDNFDAPILSVATVEGMGLKSVLAGDANGRLIFALPDVQKPEIFDTGLHQLVSEILFDRRRERVVVVFGTLQTQMDPAGTVSDGDDKLIEKLDVLRESLAKRLFGDSASAEHVVLLGVGTGIKCASILDNGDLALCDASGGLQIWGGYETLPDYKRPNPGDTSQPNVEFSVPQTSVTDIVSIPGTPDLAVATADGRIGLFTQTGNAISIFPARPLREDKTLGRLGFLNNGRTLIGAPNENGFLAWDLTDLINQFTVPPDDIRAHDEFTWNKLRIRTWLKTGRFDFRQYTKDLENYKSGNTDVEFKVLSNDQRFAVGTVDDRFVIADMRKETTNEFNLPNEVKYPPGDSGTSDEKPERDVSAVVSGRICLLDSAVGSDKQNARLSIVDLDGRQLVGSHNFDMRKIDHQPTKLIGMAEIGGKPICVLSENGMLHLVGADSDAEVNLPITGSGEQVSAFFSPKAQIPSLIIQVTRGAMTKATSFYRVNLATPFAPILIKDFNSNLRILDLSDNGSSVLLGKYRSTDYRGALTELSVTDFNLNTVTNIPEQFLNADDFTLSEDGKFLRATAGETLMQIEPSLDSIAKLSQDRLSAWSAYQDMKEEFNIVHNRMNRASWDSRREYLDKALAKSPDQPTFLLLRGNATPRSTVEEAAVAMSFYDRSLKADPYGWIAHYKKAELLWDLQKYDEATREYTTLLGLPENIPAFEEDSSWGAADPIVTAVQDATRQIIRRKHADLILYRAMAYVVTSKWADALTDVETSVALGGDTAESKFIESLAEQGLGQQNKALTSMNASLALFREHPGYGWHHMPDGIAEREAWQKYKEADILLALAQLQDKAGHPQDAAQTKAQSKQLIAAALAAGDPTDFIRQSVDQLQKTLEGKATE